MKDYFGAITDKLYSFKSRPWELNITNTIDVYDSLGSNINVYTLGSEIKRILPLKNDYINEDWISNRTRYFFEGLTKWRINIPLMKKANIMVYTSWIGAFYYFLLKVWFHSMAHKSTNLIFLNSMFVDYELIITSKILIKKLGFLTFNKNITINTNDYYLSYLNTNFFKSINNLNNEKIMIFVGYNLRLESPILNIKLRKKKLKEDILYIKIGSIFNDNLNCKNLGLNIKNLINYLQGKYKICNITLKKLKDKNENKKILDKKILDKTLFLLGNNVLLRKDNKNIMNAIKKYNNFVNILNLNFLNKNNIITNFFFNYSETNLFYVSKKEILKTNVNILYTYLSVILYEELNMFNNIHNINQISNNDIIYLLGIDDFKIKKSKFCIFQGHHLNETYLNVDLVFPNVTFLEKLTNYIDIEGNLLQTNFILFPPNFCRNDWQILNGLYIYILNFIFNIYQLNTLKKKNYLNVNRFYLLFNNSKKIIEYLSKTSMNLYYKKLTQYKLYFYNNVINNINNVNNKIIKLYNSIFNNKEYNPYIINIIVKNSNILQNNALEYNSLFNNFK